MSTCYREVVAGWLVDYRRLLNLPNLTVLQVMRSGCFPDSINVQEPEVKQEGWLNCCHCNLMHTMCLARGEDLSTGYCNYKSIQIMNLAKEEGLLAGGYYVLIGIAKNQAKLMMQDSVGSYFQLLN